MRPRYQWNGCADYLAIYILRTSAKTSPLTTGIDIPSRYYRPPPTSRVLVPAVDATLPAIADAVDRLEKELRTMGAATQARKAEAIRVAIAGVRLALQREYYDASWGLAGHRTLFGDNE